MVKKAVHALLAYQKTKENTKKLILNEHEWISLMLTVWRIPNCPQTIRIPLPHGIRPDTCEVCLFTKDEPNMSSEQTEKFYKKLLAEHGITQITEVIPLKKMKTEYKPYEAKRRLLSTFDLFLADSRIRRLLPSQIGKHFYKEKREPQSVNLNSKKLAYELNRFIQGTQLHITNKGCCYAIRVGHTGMKAEEIVDNTLAVADELAEKLPMKWNNVKVLHLKTQTSVALPVYNSSLNKMEELNLVKTNQEGKVKQKKKKSAKGTQPVSPVPKKNLPKEHKGQATPNKQQAEKDDDDDEEIPELVPIQEPVSTKKSTKKKPKGVKTLEKRLEADGKNLTSTPGHPAKKHKIQDPESQEDAKPPIKSKRERLTKQESGNREGQESAPIHSILKKTPDKTAVKPVRKLTKSARKAPLTPKLKQKKKLNVPQSA
ncbi:ribosomal L1 domain-containing protein 1 isoform X2 [Hyperolius riggenbachi]|uniref:ribosomal L1 domain-containing protein 1 isoform X2 n=1 Tax=Hyperolius riggenbachi TaxID=752182 RepID=UPI0035A2EF0A